MCGWPDRILLASWHAVQHLVASHHWRCIHAGVYDLDISRSNIVQYSRPSLWWEGLLIYVMHRTISFWSYLGYVR